MTAPPVTPERAKAALSLHTSKTPIIDQGAHPTIVAMPVGSTVHMAGVSHAVHMRPIPNPSLRIFFVGESGKEGVSAYREDTKILEQEEAQVKELFDFFDKGFEKEGKIVLSIWPRTGEILWEDAKTGIRGTTRIDTNHEQITALRKIFGKHGWYIDQWPSSSSGVKGNQTGREPFQRKSERLKKFTFNQAAFSKNLDAPAKKRLEKLDNFNPFLENLLKSRTEKYQEDLKKVQEKDPAQARHLQQIINCYTKIAERYKEMDQDALKFALMTPISTAAEAEKLRELVQKHIEALPGPTQKSMIPLGETINGLIHRTDQTIQFDEKEYAKDVALLAIIHSDSSTERASYDAACKAFEVGSSRDGLEHLMLKLFLARDDGERANVFEHPFLADLLAVLPKDEKTHLLDEINKHLSNTIYQN